MSHRLHLLFCLLFVIPWAARAQNNSWVATNGPGTGYDVRSFTATSNGTLYAGTWTDGTVWKTTDNGGTWVKCGAIPRPNPVLAMCTLPNDHIFACVYLNGVFRSTDGGATWQERDSLLTDATMRGSLVDDRGTIWVATDAGLFCTSNEGATWTLNKSAEVGQGGGFSQVYLDSSHAIVTNNWYHIFRSTDYGSTWTTIPFGTPTVSVGGIHPDGSYYASTSTSGIYRSTDFGATWTDMHSGVNWNGYTYTFTFSAAGKIYYARDANGVLSSNDSGKTWVALNSGLTTLSVLPLFRHPNGYIFAGTGGGGVFRSAFRPDSPPRLAISVSPLALSFNRVRIGDRDTLGLLVTNIGSADTLKISAVTSTNPRFAASSQALLVPPLGSRTLNVVYTPASAVVDTGTLLMTCNDTASPHLALPLSGQGYGLSDAPSIISISLLPNTSYTARIVWLRSIDDSSGAADPATEYSLWRRAAVSGGAVWEFMTAVPAIGLSEYAVDQSLPSVYNSGTTWWTFMVAVRTKGLLTYYSMPDSIQDPPLTGVASGAGPGAPRSVTMSQNYPNPFNPATTIDYGLPHAARVTLIVYNALGQEVARLVDAFEDAGYHRATFDGTTLASGVYFCRLAAGSFVRTTRMLLLR